MHLAGALPLRTQRGEERAQSQDDAVAETRVVRCGPEATLQIQQKAHLVGQRDKVLTREIAQVGRLLWIRSATLQESDGT